ncbi:hypothetical protein Lser_V15G31617 [Lactuca serriola]
MALTSKTILAITVLVLVFVPSLVLHLHALDHVHRLRTVAYNFAKSGVF